ATLLLKAAVPVKVVSERLGHASPGFTLNVYQHVLPGMQAEAALVFEHLLDGPTKGLSVAAQPPTACIDLSHELMRRLETVARAHGSSVERLVEELLGGV